MRGHSRRRVSRGGTSLARGNIVPYRDGNACGPWQERAKTRHSRAWSEHIEISARSGADARLPCHTEMGPWWATWQHRGATRKAGPQRAGPWPKLLCTRPPEMARGCPVWNGVGKGWARWGRGPCTCGYPASHDGVTGYERCGPARQGGHAGWLWAQPVRVCSHPRCYSCHLVIPDVVSVHTP